MARSVRVDVDTNVDRLRDRLGRFRSGIPDIEEETAEQFAEDLESELKKSVSRKFDRFEGDLRNNVKAKQKTSTGDGVSFQVEANAYSDDGVNYAAWHEFANRGHYAYYEEYGEQNRELIKWAKMKGIYGDTWRLFVRPVNQREGSFVQPAIDNAVSELRSRLNSDSAVSEELDESFGS